MAWGARDYDANAIVIAALAAQQQREREEAEQRRLVEEQVQGNYWARLQDAYDGSYLGSVVAERETAAALELQRILEQQEHQLLRPQLPTKDIISIADSSTSTDDELYVSEARRKVHASLSKELQAQQQHHHWPTAPRHDVAATPPSAHEYAPSHHHHATTYYDIHGEPPPHPSPTAAAAPPPPRHHHHGPSHQPSKPAKDKQYSSRKSSSGKKRAAPPASEPPPAASGKKRAAPPASEPPPAVPPQKKRAHGTDNKPTAVPRQPRLAGPFVSGVFSGNLLNADREKQTLKLVHAIICSVTGDRSGHIPPSLTMSKRQLFRVAENFLEDRNKSVFESVKNAYREVRAKHEDIVQAARASAPAPPSKELLRQERAKAKAAYEEKLKEFTKNYEKETQNLQEQLKNAEHTVAYLKEEMEAREKRQERSIQAFMTASVHSLRLVRGGKTDDSIGEEEEETMCGKPKALRIVSGRTDDSVGGEEETTHEKQREHGRTTDESSVEEGEICEKRQDLM